MDNVKRSVEKVVAFAYERWSFTRSSPVYKSFDWEKFGILEKKLQTSNGRTRRFDSNNKNVCLLLTYLSIINGERSKRRFKFWLWRKILLTPFNIVFFFLKENHLVTHLLLIQFLWFRKWLFIFDSFLILQQITHTLYTIYPLRVTFLILLYSKTFLNEETFQGLF